MPDVQSQIPGFPVNTVLKSLTIPAGASKTNIEPTSGMNLVGVFMPSAWTAADLGFEGCWNGNPNYSYTSRDAGGNAQTSVATVDTYVTFPLNSAIFAPYLKITSVATGGNSTTPVNQVAARELICVFRKFLS